jgi:CHASE2 domain-containing sensor protein
MPNSRRPIAPVEEDVLNHLEAYLEEQGDTDPLSRKMAITYLADQGIEPADARDILEQLLMKGYLYEVGDDIRFPPRS